MRGRSYRARRQFDPEAPRPSVAEPRPVLLREVLAFVRSAAGCAGVRRIALLGSLATPKPIPKDADVLVTIDGDMDLGPLAAMGRRLKGRCQHINLGADIFLCDAQERYLGRVCRHRECFQRASCDARSCGEWQHLRDDLDILTLPSEVMRRPPFVLWPLVVRDGPAPPDVEALLLRPLEEGPAARPASE